MTDLVQLPHDPEAERAVIAGLLNRPDRFEDFEAVGLGPSAFFEATLRDLYGVIEGMHSAGTPVDVLSVGQRLNGSSKLSRLAVEEIGEDFTTVEGSLHQARRVVDLAVHREIVELASQLIHDAETDASPQEVADFASLAFAELAAEGAMGGAASWYSTGDVLRTDPMPAPPGITLRIIESGECIICGGLRILLVGEAGLGKTLLGICACSDVADAGGVAVFLDCEGDLPRFLRRLHVLSISAAGFAKDPSIADRIFYRSMGDGFDRAMRLPDGTRLVVIDGLGQALAREGLDENSSTDVLGFFARMLDPLRRQAPDAAFLITDHPGHGDDTRSRGSSAKRPAVDVELTMKALAHDRAALIVRKDRDAVLGVPVGRAVAEVRRYADDGGLALELHEPDVSTDEAGNFRPTILMARVADFLAQRTEPATMTAVVSGVRGKDRAKREAVAALVREGCAVADDGPKGAPVFTYVKHPSTPAPDVGRGHAREQGRGW
jgi:hypothetical protein